MILNNSLLRSSVASIASVILIHKTVVEYARVGVSPEYIDDLEIDYM